MNEEQLKELNEYLGDGVYASFDGFQIWLAVNHHKNKVVALEDTVMTNLIRYNAKIEQYIKNKGKTSLIKPNE